MLPVILAQKELRIQLSIFLENLEEAPVSVYSTAQVSTSCKERLYFLLGALVLHVIEVKLKPSALPAPGTATYEPKIGEHEKKKPNIVEHWSCPACTVLSKGFHPYFVLPQGARISPPPLQPMLWLSRGSVQ